MTNQCMHVAVGHCPLGLGTIVDALVVFACARSLRRASSRQPPGAADSEYIGWAILVDAPAANETPKGRWQSTFVWRSLPPALEVDDCWRDMAAGKGMGGMSGRHTMVNVAMMARQRARLMLRDVQ